MFCELGRFDSNSTHSYYAIAAWGKLTRCAAHAERELGLWCDVGCDRREKEGEGDDAKGEVPRGRFQELNKHAAGLCIRPMLRMAMLLMLTKLMHAVFSDGIAVDGHTAAGFGGLHPVMLAVLHFLVTIDRNMLGRPLCVSRF